MESCDKASVQLIHSYILLRKSWVDWEEVVFAGA
jgi:hypothetical protein